MGHGGAERLHPELPERIALVDGPDERQPEPEPGVRPGERRHGVGQDRPAAVLDGPGGDVGEPGGRACGGGGRVARRAAPRGPGGPPAGAGRETTTPPPRPPTSSTRTPE